MSEANLGSESLVDAWTRCQVVPESGGPIQVRSKGKPGTKYAE